MEVKPLQGGRVELAVKVLPGPVDRMRQQVLRGFARQAAIPGFRKGRAPLSVVERFVDQEALKREIIDGLLEDAYDAATEKAGVKPLDRARIAGAELGEDGALTFTATLTLRPEVTLGEYKGLSATRRLMRVTEEQVEAELERLRARRAQYQELPEGEGAQRGYLAIVDYEVFVEGQKREDRSASGYPLEVGADQLFPELNDALVGARVGETREFQVSYPADHSDQSLAGKTADIKVTLVAARRRQFPELDDAFARQVSSLETLEALRTRIRENLEAIGRALAEEEVRDDLVRQISEASSLTVPQAIVDRETDRRIDEVTEELERRGLSLSQHLRQRGQSFEDWRADLEAEARQAARRALLLDEIGNREGIKISEAEVREEIRRLAAAEGQPEERVMERFQNEAEMNRLLIRLYQRKVLQFLVDHATITDEIVEPTTDSEQAPPAEPAAAAGEDAPAPEAAGEPPQAPAAEAPSPEA